MKQIGILGLGLIGGSIFKGLQGEARGCTETDLDQIDVLFLAVPLSQILPVAERIAKQPRERPLVVIDVGSVKGAIARQFEEWSNDKIEFVATHPMAGKEKNGFENSSADLFQQAAWVIAPHRRNREETLRYVEELICRLGAAPLRMEADLHDRRAALVSHMPYLLSCALLEFATAQDPECLAMAGPGFRSMTRLAKDDPALHREIGIENFEHIQNTLRQFYETLGALCHRRDPRQSS